MLEHPCFECACPRGGRGAINDTTDNATRRLLPDCVLHTPHEPLYPRGDEAQHCACGVAEAASRLVDLATLVKRVFVIAVAPEEAAPTRSVHRRHHLCVSEHEMRDRVIGGQ